MDLFWIALSFGAGALAAGKISKQAHLSTVKKLQTVINSHQSEAALYKKKAQGFELELEAVRFKQAQATEASIKRKKFYEDNDITNPANQLRFVGQATLRAKRPINKEASIILYALDEWIKTHHPDWRLSFEVGMGAFIHTAYDQDDRSNKSAFSSFNSKRVDFLIIDRFGSPILVIEYHGTGHDIDGTADDRMDVKRLALSKAKIPLIEVAPMATKAEVWRMVESIVNPAPPCSAEK